MKTRCCPLWLSTIPLLALLFLGNELRAQPKIDSLIGRKFPKAQLIADLDFIVEKVSTKEYGRDPFAYVNRNTFTLAADNLRKKIESRDSMSVREFFINAGEILSMVKDDHASITLGGEWSRNLIQGTPSAERMLLPLSVMTIRRDCYVLGAQGIPAGSRVLSINGMPLADALERCLKVISFCDYNASTNGMISFYDFPKYGIETYAILNWKDTIVVRYQPDETKEVAEAKIGLLRYYDRAAMREGFNVLPFKRRQQTDFTFMDNVPVLRINTFRPGKDNLEAGVKDWIVFLDTTFKQIANRGAKKLLIDISENGGGSEFIGYLLLNHIYSGKVKTSFFSAEMPVDSLVRTTLRNNAPGIKYDDFTWKRFDGKIFLLISERTFSSAARFADLFKTYSLGAVMGRPTRAFRSHYGEVKSYVLPNTGLPISVSSKFFVSASGEQGPVGIRPDVALDFGKNADALKMLTDDLLLKMALQKIAQD